MKISNTLIALTVVFAVSCTGKKPEDNHGHEHGTESHEHPHHDKADAHGHNHAEGEEIHSHEDDAHHEQEDFTIEGGSVKVGEDTTHHAHEDGSTYHNH